MGRSAKVQKRGRPILLARGDDALCQHERASDADRELAQVIEEETAGGCRQGRVSAVARWGGIGPSRLRDGRVEADAELDQEGLGILPC